MAGRSIAIWGDAPAAHAFAAGASVLGWQAKVGASLDDRHVIVPGPFAALIADGDSVDDDRVAFGWPLVTTAPVQELLRRASSVGTVTSLSSRSTRPAPEIGELDGRTLMESAHDQLALTLLVAQLLDQGAPTAVSASLSSDRATISIACADGLVAHVHTDWRSASVASQEFQLAGDSGVLRTDTDPRPSLELNGEPLRLSLPRVADESRRLLHESGVIDMLKTIGAAFDTDTIPFAFTMQFGHQVNEALVAAHASATTGERVSL